MKPVLSASYLKNERIMIDVNWKYKTEKHSLNTKGSKLGAGKVESGF